MIGPTTHRGSAAPDHKPPSGKHARGKLGGMRWMGTSRVIDRPAKQRANKNSWAKILRTARRGDTAETEQPDG